MDVNEIIDLHAAGFIASASRIALMLKDRTYLNSESREVKAEAVIMDGHFRAAFQAKNVLAEAERTLKELAEAKTNP